MADKMKPGPATPVRSIGHDGASRTNIPTAELESFVKDEEKRPTILRYPLDPQLVWKGNVAIKVINHYGDEVSKVVAG